MGYFELQTIILLLLDYVLDTMHSSSDEHIQKIEAKHYRFKHGKILNYAPSQ